MFTSAIAIAIYAILALVAIFLAAGMLLLRDTGRHADNYRQHHSDTQEQHERVHTESATAHNDQTMSDDTIAGYEEAREFWQMRGDVILQEILRDEDYWQRMIDSGALGKAQWMERQAA